MLQLPKRGWVRSLDFFKRDAQGKWQLAGTFEVDGNALELIEQIREGKAKVVAPRYQSLLIDGVELSPNPKAQ